MMSVVSMVDSVDSINVRTSVDTMLLVSIDVPASSVDSIDRIVGDVAILLSIVVLGNVDAASVD
jgi:hypothetical protein